MGPGRIAELLEPFLPGAALSVFQLDQISTYIDILTRWNARTNLTAVRTPEEIVTRHFGESLFAASHLFPAHVGTGTPPVPMKDAPDRGSARGATGTSGDGQAANGQRLTTNDQRLKTNDRVIDVGSGAGFPGLPLKIWSPEIALTLIESSHKKATFLREVCRALTLTNVNVFPGRAEDHPPGQADVVSLRAVERFDSVLPVAASLVAPGGRLALLIGRAQVVAAQRLTPAFSWDSPAPVPASISRVLLIGYRRT